jgi:hypothetical protein
VSYPVTTQRPRRSASVPTRIYASMDWLGAPAGGHRGGTGPPPSGPAGEPGADGAVRPVQFLGGRPVLPAGGVGHADHPDLRGRRSSRACVSSRAERRLRVRPGGCSGPPEYRHRDSRSACIKIRHADHRQCSHMPLRARYGKSPGGRARYGRHRCVRCHVAGWGYVWCLVKERS